MANANGIDRPTLLRFCEENKTEVLRHLGFNTAEIVRRTSFKTLFAMIDMWGGTQILTPTPKKLPKTGLARVVGVEAATAIVDYFGYGINFSVPTFGRIDALHRRFRIIGMKTKGASGNEIAREIGCSSRFVRMVLSAAGLTEKQGRAGHA